MPTPNLQLVCLLVLLSILSTASTYGAGCSGLGSDGSYAKSLAGRKGNGSKSDKTCGQDCKKEIDSARERVKKQLAACQAGGSGGISISGFQPIEDRQNAALKSHQKYIGAQEEICQDYGQFVDRMKSKAESIKSGSLTVSESFKQSNQIDSESQKKYGFLSQDARSSTNNVEKGGFTGNGPGEDPKMKQSIDRFKADLRRQVTYMKDQARKKLAERNKDSADPVLANANNGAATVRFKTQSDVDKFYKGMDQCDAALKSLDSYGQKYKKLSSDLADAKKEGEAAQAFFQSQQQKFGAQANKMAGKETGMDSAPTDGGLEANAGRKPAPLNPTDGGMDTNPSSSPVTATNQKSALAPVQYDSAKQDSLISQGQDSRRTAIGGTVLGTFTRDGQVYEVMGAKSYNGTTPYYARPKK